jgi:hypothetical protein
MALGGAASPIAIIADKTKHAATAIGIGQSSSMPRSVYRNAEDDLVSNVNLAFIAASFSQYGRPAMAADFARFQHTQREPQTQDRLWEMDANTSSTFGDGRRHGAPGTRVQHDVRGGDGEGGTSGHESEQLSESHFHSNVGPAAPQDKKDGNNGVGRITRSSKAGAQHLLLDSDDELAKKLGFIRHQSTADL